MIYHRDKKVVGNNTIFRAPLRRVALLSTTQAAHRVLLSSRDRFWARTLVLSIKGKAAVSLKVVSSLPTIRLGIGAYSQHVNYLPDQDDVVPSGKLFLIDTSADVQR
jgi:hypothetical protein